MTETVPRKPRNTRLSAYYGLQSAPSDPKPSAAPAAVPADRTEALRHATELTRTLPLADLLQRSTELRLSSQNLQTSLHTSVRRYYEHLDATSEAARSAAEHASALSASADAVAACAQRCAGVNSRLSDARAAVDRLEGARRAALLQDAAHRLTDQLEPAYRELADLCTDPAAARARLFLAARRTAVVLPAVQSLAPRSPEFAEAATALGDAAARVRAEVRSRGSEDDPYGLTLVDAIHLRRLLGDSTDVLREAFWEACGRQICDAAPSEAARAAVGPSPLAMARLYVVFAADQTIPMVFSMAEKYADIFGPDGVHDGDDAWHDFVVWVTDVLDEAVASRVRRALQSSAVVGTGEVETIRAFLASIDKLLSASAAAAANASVVDAANGKKGQEPQSTVMVNASAQLDEVVRSMGEGLRTGLVESISREMASQWQRLVDGILSGDGSQDAVDEVMNSVWEICKRGEWLSGLDGGMQWTEEALLQEVARYAMKGQLVENADLGRSGRAAMVCRELGKRSKDRATVEALRKVSERIFEHVRQRVCERVEDILAARLEGISKLGDDSPRSSSSSLHTASANTAGVSAAIEALCDADAIGKACGVAGLRSTIAAAGGMHEGDELLLGEDDSVAAAVARTWVELVRGCSIASEAGVHALQLDACEVSEGIGREGAFAEVARAAVERCSDAEAVLLGEEQVQEAWRQRAAVRRR